VLAGSVTGTFTAEALVGSSMAGRALTMLGVVPQWIRLLVWPAHLRADYSPGEFVASTTFGVGEALGLVLLLETVALAWSLRRRAPVVTFGLAWCAIALFPVSNVLVPTGILIAERTLFLPSIGFLVAVGGVAEYWMRHAGGVSPVSRRAVATACGALVLLGATRSATRERAWQSEGSIWLATIRDAPRSWRAQHAFGDMLFHLGFEREGREAYEKAIRFAPEPWRLHTDLARRLREMGQDSAALGELQRSIARHPSQEEATTEMVAALLGVGRYGEARRMVDSLVAAGHASSVMQRLQLVADSALAVRAPPGSIRLRVRVPGAPAGG
jgi:hypothetical protein